MVRRIVDRLFRILDNGQQRSGLMSVLPGNQQSILL